LQVDALDISADALSVAKENAMANAAKVNFIQSDILGYESPTQYDFIVSNPPYITEEERGEMHRNVLSYEPGLALFVSNENPLIFYKSIADFAVRNLRRTGYLFFEINEYLSKETIDMLTDKGFINIELKSDMQGKDRMIRCRLSIRPGDGIR
jgi:release factor glutamine methyltransferase